MYIQYVVDIQFLKNPNINNEYHLIVSVDFSNVYYSERNNKAENILGKLKVMFPDKKIILIDVNKYIINK